MDRPRRDLAWIAVLLLAAISPWGCGSRTPRSSVTADDPETGWTPITTRRNLIFVPGHVGDLEVSVLVDSGSERTILSRRAVERLGIEEGGETKTPGVGGESEAVLLPEVRLEMCGRTLVDGSAIGLDLSRVSDLVGHRFDAVVGHGLFRAFVVDLDLPGERIRLLDPEPFQPEPGAWTTVPMRFVPRGMQIEASVEDREPTWLDVDTGSTANLTVYPTYWGPERLDEGRERSSTAWGAGAGGSVISPIVTLRSLEVGGIVFRDLPATLFQDAEAAFARSGASGNLGNGVLSRMRLVFDASRDELHLQPGPDVGKPFSKERAGLAVRKHDRSLEVVHVSPGSPAEREGFRIGDVIVAVDGRAIDDDSWEEFHDWNSREAGTRVELTLQAGEVRSLVLEDYY